MYLLSRNDSESLQYWLKELKEFQLDSMFDTNVLARAYLYTNSIKSIISEKNIILSEVGNTNIYNTKLTSINGEVYGSCSCPYDGKCKHLVASILVSIQS